MKTFFFVLGVLILSFQASAQSINEIEKRANEAFDSKKYSVAKTDFQILFSRDPKSPTYNYKFACCLFFTDEKNASFKHFELAAKLAPGICEANYFLGRLYHQNFDFKRAISSFKTYLSCFPADELHAQTEIEYCKNAELLMNKQHALAVLNSQQLPLSGFLSRIEFDEVGIGGGYYTDLSLQTKSDKNKGFIPHTYVKAGNKIKIFASHGENTLHTSLFAMTKEGENWSKPQKIRMDACENCDLLYPFFDPESGMLYFSSNGFNSMGGFDFFKTKFTPETMQIEEVENVGFPFSSTDNDYLFIPLNANGSQAYFATVRSSPIGKIEWIHGKMENTNANIVLLQGKFMNQISPKNTQILVKVKNTKDGLEYGPFVSDSLGNYELMLPGAGVYEFTATITGTQQVFKDTKELPAHASDHAILQSINYNKIETKESINFDYQFHQTASEELKNHRNLKIASLSKEFNPVPITAIAKDASTQPTAGEKLNEWGFNQGNVLQQSDALADRLLEIANFGEDYNDHLVSLDLKKDEVTTKKRKYESTAETLVAKINADTGQVAKRVYQSHLLAIYDSLIKFENTLTNIEALITQLEADRSAWNKGGYEQKANGISDALRLEIISKNETGVKNNISGNQAVIAELLQLIQKENSDSSRKSVLSDQIRSSKEDISNLELQQKASKSKLEALQLELKSAKKKEKESIEQQIVDQNGAQSRLQRMIEIKRNEIEEGELELLALDEKKRFQQDFGYVPNFSNTGSPNAERLKAPLAAKTALQKKLDSGSQVQVKNDAEKLKELEANFEVIKLQLELSNGTGTEMLLQQYQKLEAQIETIKTEDLLSKTPAKGSTNTSANSTGTTSQTNGLTENNVANTPEKGSTNTSTNNTGTTTQTNALAENNVAKTPEKGSTNTSTKNTGTTAQTNGVTENNVANTPEKGSTNTSANNTGTTAQTNALAENNVAKTPEKGSTNTSANSTGTTSQTNGLTENNVANTPEKGSTNTSVNNTEPTAQTNALTENNVAKTPEKGSTNTNANNTEPTAQTNAVTENNVAKTPEKGSTNTSTKNTGTTAQTNGVTENNVANTPEKGSTNTSANNTGTTSQTNGLTENNVANTPEKGSTNTSANNTEPTAQTNALTENNVAKTPEKGSTNTNANNTEPTAQTNAVTENNVAKTPEKGSTNTSTKNTGTTAQTNGVTENNVAKTPEKGSTNTSANSTGTTSQTNGLTENNVANTPEKGSTNTSANNTGTTAQTNALTENNVAKTPEKGSTNTSANNTEPTAQTNGVTENNVEKTPEKGSTNTNANNTGTTAQTNAVTENNVAKTPEKGSTNTNANNTGTTAQTNALTENNLVNNSKVSTVDLDREAVKGFSSMDLDAKKQKELMDLHAKLEQSEKILDLREQIDSSLFHVLFSTKELRTIAEKLESDQEHWNTENNNSQFQLKTPETFRKLANTRQQVPNLIEFKEKNIEPQNSAQLAKEKSYDDYITLRKKINTNLAQQQLLKLEIVRGKVPYFQSRSQTLKDSLAQALKAHGQKMLALIAEEKNLLNEMESMPKNEVFAGMVASGVVPTPGIEPNRKLMLSSVKDVEFKMDKELMTSNNAYPVLSTLPKGLVYRVQLGVFKNAVPDYLYREFTPVSGEALNNGLTAYLAGYFERAALANGVKNDIRNLGYKDAFVVAYCDGQRIALAKALEYENSGACSIRGHEDLMVEAFSLLKKTDGDMTANTSKPREVFYTVQVASLTKEDKGKLSNVPELFYVPSKNGKFKYSSGKFSQLELAKSRRNVLRNEGYTDAYIVAYRDGIPVSFNEAEIALNYMREKPIETSIPKNNDLSGILDVLTNPVTIEWVKRDSNLTMEKLGNYNTLRYFVTDGKGTVSSVPIPAEECSPLEYIHYTDFEALVIKETRESLEIAGQVGGSNTTVFHNFALKNNIPFTVTNGADKNVKFIFYADDANAFTDITSLANKLNLTVESK